MDPVILTVTIRQEHDTVLVRQRARQIARLFGFDAKDQTRISTAVSEIARNAFNYAGGGRAEYILHGRTAPQLFIVKITDSGPGIRDLDSILEGRYHSSTGMGLGITGSRRLMDQFEIETVHGRGTTVWLKILLPKRSALIKDADLARITSALAREKPQDAFQELQHQNQELLAALEDIRIKQADLTRVNRELEDTNRGVVALYAELDEKADHLRRADELKSRFLSNMSHEFRSPLNSILALSGLLLNRTDGDLTAEQNQQVGYVRRAAQDLLDLVNDLLDLAKVEAGKIEAKPVEFEAANLFAAMRGMLRPLLVNQSIELVFDDAGHIPRLFSDEGKVSQILRNFISNALKFTESGEIRVSAALSGSDEVCFSVSDTGIGIAPQDRDLIFEDFGQVDHPIQKRVKGTGLGLPLSKKLATLLQGRVELESQVGVGSTFTLRLPIRYRDPVAPEPPLLAVPFLDPASIALLVVDDQPEMQLMYKSYLKGAGFQAVPASTTWEAEGILESTQPGCIILDILLRAEDTWAFLAKLKSDTRTKNIPVVVVSSVDDQAKAFHLGADGYLVKPIERDALLQELKSLTGEPALTRVLLIDDEESDRYILKQHLKNLPVVVSEASGGADGIRQACQQKPGIIFLDLTMPGMDGFETLDRLKEEPVSRDIPVAIVTSRFLLESERNELMTKAFAIMNKDGLNSVEIADILRRATTDLIRPAIAR